MRLNPRYLLLLICSCQCFIGCSERQVPAETDSVAEQPRGLKAKLQAADKLDGNEDHVIGRCYVCALGMDGKPDHTAEFHGYKALLCSENCLIHFNENAENWVEKTTIPKSKQK